MACGVISEASLSVNSLPVQRAPEEQRDDSRFLTRLWGIRAGSQLNARGG